MINKSEIQVANFISLIDHLKRNPTKITYTEVLKPMLENFLESPDKFVLAKVLTHVNFKQGEIKRVSEILIKYNKIVS